MINNLNNWYVSISDHNIFRPSFWRIPQLTVSKICHQIISNYRFVNFVCHNWVIVKEFNHNHVGSVFGGNDCENGNSFSVSSCESAD